VVDNPSYKKIAEQLRSKLLKDWDPAETERNVLASQRLRMFLKDALYEGEYTPWDYQPISDASQMWVRRTSNRQWDPDLGT
jgi:choline-sulfatase